MLVGKHILYHQRIVDAFGHISVRHDDDPNRYVMARHLAPGLVTEDDLLTYDLDSVPLVPTEHRLYGERFIHGEIYKARPDVMSVVHCHAPALIPFGITKAPLQPIYHVSAFLADGVPKFEIRDSGRNDEHADPHACARRRAGARVGQHQMVLDARARRDDGRQLDPLGRLQRDLRHAERARFRSKRCAWAR